MNVTIKGGALTRARLLAGLSTKDLGERAGVSSETVRNAENGKRMPFPASIKAIADALGVDVAEFYIFADVDEVAS